MTIELPFEGVLPIVEDDQNESTHDLFENNAPDESIGDEINEIASSPLQKLDMKGLNQVLNGTPSVIRDAVNIFSSSSERIMVFAGTIVCAGGLLTQAFGRYHGRKFYASLFLAIVAGPASNKGVIVYIRKLIEPVHKYFREQSNRALTQYQQSLRNYKANLKDGIDGTPPEVPPYQIPIISGDITAAKFIVQMHDNNRDGRVPCYIVEDEIDPLVSSCTGENGKALPSMWRSSYQHADYSQQLKSFNQHYEITNPILSIAIAGTVNQMAKLIGGSIENGLYSRFMIINVNDSAKWQDVSPCDTCPDRDILFYQLGHRYFDFWQTMGSRNLEVRLRPHQWKALNMFGEHQLNFHHNLKNEMLGAVVKRHCLMLFRICMILTCLRYWENNAYGKVLYCTDTDFRTALLLTRHSMACSIEFFSKMPGGGLTGITLKKDTFLKNLPDYFIRHEAVTIGNKLKLSVRQIDRYLNEFISARILSKVMQGTYEKTSMAKWQMAETDEI